MDGNQRRAGHNLFLNWALGEPDFWCHIIAQSRNLSVKAGSAASLCSKTYCKWPQLTRLGGVCISLNIMGAGDQKPSKYYLDLEHV